jgi:hypothetical protein
MSRRDRSGLRPAGIRAGDGVDARLQSARRPGPVDRGIVRLRPLPFQIQERERHHRGADLAPLALHGPLHRHACSRLREIVGPQHSEVARPTLRPSRYTGTGSRCTIGETAGARPCLAYIASMPNQSSSRPTNRLGGPPARRSATSARLPTNSAGLSNLTRRPRPSSNGEYLSSGDHACRALVYSASIRIKPASTRATSRARMPNGWIP